MKVCDADDYRNDAAEPECAATPLFDPDAFEDERPGPFAQSNLPPTTVEAAIAQVIWEHPGRKRPISIAEIITHFDTKIGLSDGPDRLSPRTVKGIVEQLRVSHGCPIGARREEPAGYFWIMDAADREEAVRPYREQIKTMWRTFNVLESPAGVQSLYAELCPEVG